MVVFVFFRIELEIRVRGKNEYEECNYKQMESLHLVEDILQYTPFDALMPLKHGCLKS